MNESIQLQIKLHTQDNLSVYEIASILHLKPNTVLVNLRYHKVLKKNSGYSIERKVEEYFRQKGLFVVPQKGDAPFDLIIGKEYIEVKSAHAYIKSGKKRFFFAIEHFKTKNRKDFSNIDWMIFVFIDRDLGNPMYRMRPSELHGRKGISFSPHLIDTYPLEFIGRLEL